MPSFTRRQQCARIHLIFVVVGILLELWVPASIVIERLRGQAFSQGYDDFCLAVATVSVWWLVTTTVVGICLCLIYFNEVPKLLSFSTYLSSYALLAEVLLFPAFGHA